MEQLIYNMTWWFFIALTVLPAVYMLLTKDVMRAAFALLACFLGVAGLYVFLQAYFLAVTQIMVYVGGVLVLIIFGIMLSAERGSGFKIITGERNKTLGWIAVLALLGGFYWMAKDMQWLQSSIQHLAHRETKAIGMEIMLKFILPFEIIGLLLLIALIGAVYISKDLNDD